MLAIILFVSITKFKKCGDDTNVWGQLFGCKNYFVFSVSPEHLKCLLGK